MLAPTVCPAEPPAYRGDDAAWPPDEWPPEEWLLTLCPRQAAAGLPAWLLRAPGEYWHFWKQGYRSYLPGGIADQPAAWVELMAELETCFKVVGLEDGQGPATAQAGEIAKALGQMFGGGSA